MNADELAKRTIDRVQNPQAVPAIIWRVVSSVPPEAPMIDNQPDEIIECVTPDGRLLGRWLKSQIDEI
jgi:hypothetical protein